MEEAFRVECPVFFYQQPCIFIIHKSPPTEPETPRTRPPIVSREAFDGKATHKLSLASSLKSLVLSVLGVLDAYF